MLTALEVLAGLVLTSSLVTALAVLMAFELGRMITRDDEQVEVEPTRNRRRRFDAAA